MGELSVVLTGIADAIRGQKDKSDDIKIKATEMSAEIFTISEAFFTENMVDGYGLGLQSIKTLTFDCKEVQNLADNSFVNIKSLEKVVFDVSNGHLTTIGKKAFSGCTSLTDVTLIEGLESIGENAFENCNIKKIHLPKTIRSLTTNPFRFNRFMQEITVDEENEYYTSKNGKGEECNCIITRDTQKIVMGSLDTTDIAGVAIIGTYAFSLQGLEQLSIPNSVTTIEVYAFSSNDYLERIEFEEGSSITAIPNHCFYTTKMLSYINLPDSVTSIGAYAFQYNNKLTEFIFPPYIETIGGSAFSNFTVMEKYDFSNYKRTVPPTLSGANAFSGSSSGWWIVVPDDEELYQQWTSDDATNWVVYRDAGKIIKLEDYNKLKGLQ